MTDLGWPPYRDLVEGEAKRTGRLITSMQARDIVCDPRTAEDDVVDAVFNKYLDAGCDGLFLTAVSHLGFRLPVERIVRTIEAARPLRFVVVDGAQDFCHATADLRNEYCDLYLTGCHKWLQGFHPMGLGFYGRQRSRGRIETLLAHLLSTGEIDDPLLRFTTQLESASLDGDTETVNLIPLFTCQGAAADALDSYSPLPIALRQRQENLALAVSLAQSRGWHSILPAEPFRTGILLLQADRETTRSRAATDLRGGSSRMKRPALTAYDDGIVRLSMPAVPWRVQEIDRLGSALQTVA